VTVAAPLWREFILKAFEEMDLSNEPFSPPDPREGNKPILNGEYSPNGEVHTILHYVQKDDPLGPPPAERDSAYTNWETAVNSYFGGSTASSAVFTINSPLAGSILSRATPLSVEIGVVLSSESPQGIEVFIDGVLMGKITGPGPSYTISFSLPQGITSGLHVLSAQLQTSSGSRPSVSIPINVAEN
jgi:hypothetical protein